MFKIESYLTPIILNHVAQFVKDFRPQDAQLSLWQGEVQLQNLNMRLDVLEQELQLPFELLSGHIHELNILVPWTKITSEPIKVTINTIEFVLKMKKDSDESARSSSSGTRKIKKQEELQQEQGGLVNKIIKNIEVNCHNIILKLVVEDIVLSMNVQLLSFSSADENWAPAMLDINPLKVILRKLIKISDLTICLDKRNEAGQIEVCQEPVLYRCNLELRILDKYNVRTKATCSTKRMGIFTELLDINISSLQFPMVMRLCEALCTLGVSKIPISPEKSDEVFSDPQSDTHTNQSYFSWLWNSLPTFDFDLFEGDDSGNADSQTGHTKDVGVYIEHLNVTLKSSEFISDGLMSTSKRVRYIPIVRVSLGGMYLEKVSAEELGWSSVKTGLTSIVIEPLGPYFNEEVSTNALLECSSTFEIGNSFIDKSIFDKRCVIADKGWGVTNYEEYSNRITDEYLLYRTPVLAFDLVEYKTTNHDDSEPTTSNSNPDKRIQYRLLSSGVTFRYNQVFLQVTNIIHDYVKSYDYPEYYAEAALDKNLSLSKLEPPQTEDFEAFMTNIPLCTYRFKLKKINLEIYTLMDPPVEGESKHSTKATQWRLPKHMRQTMKYFLVQLEYVEGQLTRPLEPNKLVEATCQLPRKELVAPLLEACYNNYSVNVNNLQIALTNAGSNSLSKIVTVPNISCKYSNIIMPNLWSGKKYVPRHTLKVYCDQFVVEFSKRELNTIYHMLHCIQEYKPRLIWIMAKQESIPLLSKETIKLHNKFTQLQVLLNKYKLCFIWNISIKSLMSEIVYQSKRNEKRYELLNANSNEGKWLEVQGQLPNNSDELENNNKVVFALWIEKFSVSIDKHLLKFLNYSEERERFLQEAPLSTESLVATLGSSPTLITSGTLVNTPGQSLSRQLVRHSSRNSLPSDRKTRKVSHPEETVHFSSDRDDKTAGAETKYPAAQQNSSEPISMERLRFLKEFITHIEVAQSELRFGEDLSQLQTTSEYTKIQLPHIVIDSADANQIARSDINVIIDVRVPIDKNTFNWTINITGLWMENHSPSTVDDILMPIETKISVALMHQTEVPQRPSVVTKNRRSRASIASGRSVRSTRLSIDVGVGIDSPSDSLLSLEESEEDLPAHRDKVIQISRSCDSISLLQHPSLQNIPSELSVASTVRMDGSPSADMVRRVGSSVSMGSRYNTKLSIHSLGPLKDVISLSLHADTTPIHVICSVNKIKTLIRNFTLLSRIYDSLIPASFRITKHKNNASIEIVTPLEEHVNIKEFLELEASSGKESVLKNIPSFNLTESFLCQWTVTKIIFELVSGNEKDQVNTSKCVLEFEDLLSTVDKHNDYTKYTGKVGQFNLNYMDLSPSNEWIVNERLRIKMLPGSGNPLPFLNVIITSVSSKDFHTRIGAHRKNDGKNHNIWEICLSIEAIEIILDIETLAKFVRPLCPLWISEDRFKQQTMNKNPLDSSQFLTSSNLPMIYLDSKGFVLYLPVKSAKETCTVLILKIQSIDITPSLQNPLQRTPIRADVFAKAAALGIINTPGSILEDRQYELTLNNICLLSGDFEAILAHMSDRSNNFLHTNPAFEWNNKARKSIQLLPTEIFNNFTFICIFAPCILYKNVLICGQAIEFNCASELIAAINTNEMNLGNCLILQLYEMYKIINLSTCSSSTLIQKESSDFRSTRDSLIMERLSFVSCSSHPYKSGDCLQRQNSWDKRRNWFSDPQSASGSNIFSSIDENNEQNVTHKSDSGFYSCLSSNGNIRLNSSDRLPTITSSSSALQQISASSMQRKVPNTVSLIAGEFIIQIFDVIQKNKSVPLISFTITEPSFMISQNIYDLSTQMTLFGFTVNIATGDLTVRRRVTRSSSGAIRETDGETVKDLFPYNLLETKQGTLGATGIPPPLFSCKTHLSKKQLLELNIEVSKPLVLTVSGEYIEQLVKHFRLMNQVLLENPCFEVHSIKPIVRETKNKLMRRQFFNADRLHFKLDWLEVTFSNDNDYNCSLIFADARANVKFLSRPEKANGKLSISNIHIKTNDRVVLHPIGMRASADFVTEPWYSLPLVSANVRFNVVQIDVGVHELLQIRRALTEYMRISELFLEEWQQFLRNVPNEEPDISVNRENLVPIKCPAAPNHQSQRKKNKDKVKQREEFYQDDLRAGAFQFVEMATDSLLPQPYQVLIIKKNFGIVCWRYPQPRKMSKIQIFPVPMAVPNPIHIKCRMEYFSETYEGFLYFCDFWLSETVSKELDLPERPICANIWRVVILQSLVSVNGDCFDASEEDEELQSITTLKTNNDFGKNDRQNPDFILDPKLLVGCMRIDSSFQSESVPKVQLLISFNILKVNFLNHPAADAELPNFLEGYKLTPTTQINQTFLSLNVERMNLFFSLPSFREYSLNVDMTFSIKCIDYGFLNMVNLLEESTLHSYFHVNKEDNSVMVDVVHDKIRVNFGPTILHTLLSAKRHWEESLSVADEQSKSRHHTFIPKFVIVNQTFSVVSFGQTGSTERIQLQPKEVHMYSFRSNFNKQELTFFISDNDSLITEASQSVPISLKIDGNVLLQNIRIGNKCLIIKSQKLSATQIYVLIKGQFELISMVPHELHLEIRREGKQYNENNTLEYSIQPMGRCSFFRSVQNNKNVFMRLKFMNGTAKGRSGDIPLRTNKHLPWLVKVPHKNNKFISFWVRVLREDISDFMCGQFQPQRVLITIWPIFEICSMLTSPISAQESTSTEGEFEVEPKGGRYLLDVPATHLTEHKVTFQYKFPVDETLNTDYVLSLKTIDWNEFFWYDEQMWRIEYALQELPAIKRINWPLNDTEELRLQRMSRTEDKSTINYDCTPSRDFACSLCLKVSAWGLFINATGLIISVCDYETKTRLLVESNGIEMMLAINTAFTVEIRAGKQWIASLPIYFKETSSTAKEKFYVAVEDISSEIVILCGAEVVKFVLDFKIEEERKIFILRSKYNVINFTKIDLCIIPFALDHKESSTRNDIKRLDAKVRKKSLPSVKISPDCIGQTLDNFYDLHSLNTLRTSDSAFVSFVCFKLSDDSEFSIPIPLTMQFARKCFSLQNGTESIPFVVTLIEHNGIFYLSIFDDLSPAILINNQTDMKLVVAQTNAAENSKVSSTTPEYDGKHFVWNQLVAPFSNCYYTPPEMYVNFPDVESTKCNLTLALWKENITKSYLHWSKPLRTDKSWEKYLHVPKHGDVKVIICDKHNITRVSIYYISQPTEFSVKDLRSRLLLPATSSQPHNLDVSGISLSSTSITSLLSAVSDTSDLTPKANPSDTCIHFRYRSDLKTRIVNIKLRFFIKEINVNLNSDHKDRDYSKTDIFALYIDDFMLAYDSDYNQRQLNVLLANMQVDNQLFSSGNYDFPVVLCSQELYKRDPILPQLHFLDRLYADLRSSQPMVAIGVNFFDDELKVSSLECSISPIRAYIEDAYLNDLLDAIVEFVPANCVYLPEDEPERLTLKPGQILLPRKIAEQSFCMAEPMKLQSFRIQPLNLLLSVHTSVRLYIALDHSPLSFSSYERRQINSVPLRFGQSVGMHYLSGAIFGAGWVVGSLEILGSPSGLARSFSTGLRDFVSMPVRGLLRGPWGFIVGITQGSASLLRNVTAGTVNSVTKLASSVARNLDRMSLDKDHIERTEALRRLRPQGFTEGLSQGVTGLGISLLGAVGGIARHTLEARTPGQVVTGVGKGLVGAVTKPLGGAAELLALTGQGVLQSVGFNTMPQQRTKPSANKVIVEPSDYRIWKLLPGISSDDQILFYQEVTVKVQLELKRAFILLTSEAFAIIEAKTEKLSLVLPLEKVEMSIDPEDKTLIILRITPEKENEDEEDISYTNERIMTFIRSSFLSIQSLQTTLKSDSQNELLQKSENRESLDWAFYINEHLGEYLLDYIKIIRRKYELNYERHPSISFLN